MNEVGKYLGPTVYASRRRPQYFDKEQTVKIHLRRVDGKLCATNVDRVLPEGTQKIELPARAVQKALSTMDKIRENRILAVIVESVFNTGQKYLVGVPYRPDLHIGKERHESDHSPSAVGHARSPAVEGIRNALLEAPEESYR